MIISTTFPNAKRILVYSIISTFIFLSFSFYVFIPICFNLLLTSQIMFTSLRIWFEFSSCKKGLIKTAQLSSKAGLAGDPGSSALIPTFGKAEAVDDFPVEVTDSDFPVDIVGDEPRRGSIEDLRDLAEKIIYDRSYVIPFRSSCSTKLGPTRLGYKEGVMKRAPRWLGPIQKQKPKL